MTNDIPGLSLGIVKNGEKLYTRGYGVADVSSPKPVTDRTLFHTASISKLFTAQAVQRMVAAGIFSLDDRVTDLLPELAARSDVFEEITIRQLLTHTSGLPDVKNYEWGNPDQSKTVLPDYILSLKARGRRPAPAPYRYSNLGYDLLGYLIQNLSKLSFEAYVKSNVLQPAGMDGSDFRYYQLPVQLFAAPHTRQGGKVKVRKVYPHNRAHAPSSTLVSSAADLSRWMEFFLGQSEATDNDTLLGFQRYDYGGKTAIGHYGGDKGFRSFLWMLPEEGIGIVVLANADWTEDFRDKIVQGVAAILREN